MDEDLATRIQAAIDGFLADNGGGFVTGWHFIADFIDSDSDGSWLFATAENQKATTTMGLLRWAQGVADYELSKYLEDL